MRRLTLLLAVSVAACASPRAAPISYGGAPASTRQETRAPRAETTQRSDGRGAPIEFRGNAPTQQTQPRPAESTPAPTSQAPVEPRRESAAPEPEAPRMHRVAPGETLYDVASRYQIPLIALIGQNGLEPPYEVAPGQELELPPLRFHIVSEGESFEEIADAYSMDHRSLALLNHMQPPYVVTPGQRLALPAVAVRAAPTIPATATNAPIAIAPPLPSADARFAMPLRGEVVARFGPQPGGLRLDGIEIAGREGDPIRAAADGEVVYAGSDVPGYGTLVLVRHADNYVTGYGHARRALVREGQRVRAGETIAELGRRGDGEARLLFQVRQGTQAVDPGPLLGFAQ